MRKADVTNGKYKTETPHNYPPNHSEWFIGTRIFFCQEKSLEIQENVDNSSVQRL